VFARIRPIMEFEQAKGQTAVLNVPDELTVTHLWKGAPREYSFDNVFSPEASQEQVMQRLQGTKCFGNASREGHMQGCTYDRQVVPSACCGLQVFEDTKHLVRSAVDGYNVCIFAYGQTGSGAHPAMQAKLPRLVAEPKPLHSSIVKLPLKCAIVRAGKTHTMAGNPKAPGLAPRGIEELFRGSHSACKERLTLLMFACCAIVPARGYARAMRLSLWCI
jgi:Microtubule binding